VIADPNKALYVYEQVWHCIAGGGSPSLCSNRRICAIAGVDKDVSSGSGVNNNNNIIIIGSIFVWGVCYGLWPGQSL